MTLLVIEAMAQAAYYIAYREFNGAGPALSRPAGGAAAAAAAAGIAGEAASRISHPYYGYTRSYAGDTLNQAPPPRRQDGVALIALLGGSVAWQVADAFRSALEAWFRDNGIPLRPVVLELSHQGWKQPQQMIVIANTLALGGEYDIIVNLDGYNELVFTENLYFGHNQAPFFPHRWLRSLVNTNREKLLVSRIYALRQRQQRLEALAAAEPWRRLALYGIVNRYLRERAAAQLLARHRDLDQAATEYDLESHGPIWPAEPDDGMAPDAADLSRIALRVWYRSSVLLAGLSRDAGAEYYHFQQPNQYVPDAKPLSDQERAYSYNPQSPAVRAYRNAHPQLLRFGAELRRQGINYYDLTRIFADHRETLYQDACCHFNERGNELLAASMVQHLEPALRNLGRSVSGYPVNRGGGIRQGKTALDAAIYEKSPVHSVNKMYFDVFLSDAGAVHYSRDNCLPAETAAPFFVRITPAAAVDLLPGGVDAGYNSYDFSFDREGGTIDGAGWCVVEYELPEYDIASVLTGQYAADSGQALWQARLTLDLGFEVAVARNGGGGVLRYSRDDCLPTHIGAYFFLHITPVDAADLQPHTAEYGFNNLDFSGFSPDDGIMDGGRCVIERMLPDYPIASILTGQHIPQTGYRLWETRIDVEQP